MEPIALHVSQLDIVLLLTEPMNFSSPHSNLHVHMELFPPDIGHHLAGKYRPFVVSSLLGSLHDLYVMMEEDMALRFRHLHALCAEVDFLCGTNYFPGFLRYETASQQDADEPPQDPSSLFLPDHCYSSDLLPNSTRIFRIAGREFALPENPYQALVVLPADHFYQVFLKMGHHTMSHFLQWPSINREYFATSPSLSDFLAAMQHCNESNHSMT
eukprot:GGOE01004848.1.p1 GENE.GGOE01004848.1~~GGOE01004848.1.p1  ORF type:complete len:214 (-),score=39.81 GGOE01004848.1:143-784(-)